MTDEDRLEIRTLIETALQATEGRFNDSLQATEGRFNHALQATEERLTESQRAALQATEERLTETIRDMQTEMLRGLEAFARGNFARFHAVESAQTDLGKRMAAIEERVLYLETRRPPRQ